MNPKIADLAERIKALERELEAELAQTRDNIRYRLINEKIYFEHEILAQHRRLKTNLFRYVLFARPRHLLTAPFVYALLPPLLLLDLFVSLYHAVCFPLLGIPKVRRSDYLVFDRHQLAYLNLLEKVNCAYCSYGNGLLSYMKEIVGRTEQYWCPIRHARRTHIPHSHYRHFIDYGDAEGFRRDLKKLRKFKD